jgi:cbb3-type cytochrome oxidase subunit 3
MYKNVLASIPGIEYYPIVALALFFSFFIGLTIWYFRADRQLLNVQANQPFDEGVPTTDLPTTHTMTRS